MTNADLAPARDAERRRAGIQLLRELEVDGLVSSDAGDVMWLSGFAVPHESWPSLIDVPAAVVMDGTGARTVVVPELLEEGSGIEAVDEVLRYQTHGLLPELNLQEAFAEAVASAASRHGFDGSTVAVNAGLPVAAASALGWSHLKVLEHPTMQARARKTPDEIELIRKNARLCDAFQRCVREEAAAGRTEIEIFAAARRRVEAVAGRRLTILGDLVSGPRTLDGGGPPTSRVVEPGDAVLCDVSISRNGYWADTCTTICVGGASEQFRGVAQVVVTALNQAIAACQVGARASAIDAEIRSFMADHGYGWGHHLGHGVGTSYHELPRFVPNSADRLEEDMVVCLEPTVLTGAPFGVRHEVVGVVRQGGFELLSTVPAIG
jgi:Xaa-Pro aminopeptidase